MSGLLNLIQNIKQTLHIIAHYCHDKTPPINQMIYEGLIPKIIDVYKQKRFGLYTKFNQEFYRTYTWCLSALTQYEHLGLSQIIELNGIAHEIFLMVGDEQQAKNLLWYYIRTSENAGEKLPVLLASDEKGQVVKKIISYLNPPEECISVSVLAFKTLSNYLQTRDENIIQSLIDKKILDGFNSLLSNCPPNQFKKIEKMYMFIADIVLVSNQIVKSVISHPIFDNIIQAAQKYTDKRKLYAITCLCNLQQTSTYEQINAYYDLDIYKILIGELNQDNEEDILQKIVDALYCSVYKSDQVNDEEKVKFLSKLEQLNLSAKFDELQNHPSQPVFEKVINFVEAFYPSLQN